MQDKVYICEFCGKEHDGSYGSGRFCSKTCRAKHAAKNVKNHKCNFNSNGNGKKPKEEGWQCCHCLKIFRTRAELYAHIRKEHPEFCFSQNGHKAWNKGLTKETNSSLNKASETYKSKIRSGEIKNWWEGKNLSCETKEKISNSMKKAHVEGRAYKLGTYSRGNEPSGPEKMVY